MNLDVLNDLYLPAFLEGEDVPMSHLEHHRFFSYTPEGELIRRSTGEAATTAIGLKFSPLCPKWKTRLWIDDVPAEVSTVRLGLNHQFGDGPPLIYETMIFASLGSLDSWMHRYTTKAAAEHGHHLIVDALLAAGARPATDDGLPTL